MQNVDIMIKAHPMGSSFNINELSDCITECFSCGQTCQSCADACLAEDNVKDLIKCIRLNLDCADVCITTGSMLSRLTSFSDELLRDQLKACETACEVCGSECGNHQHHEHCSICADSCRRCKEICQKMLSSMGVVA